jgi:DNA-binding NarL/FixJ family response regulator
MKLNFTEVKRHSYIAVICDIVGSKEVEDRAGLQDELRSVLNEVNTLFASTIAADFLLTIGDEFQGLLCSPDDVVQLLSKVRAAVHPVELRFGLGVGKLDTALRKQALGMDGSCFHRARTAIERAAKRRTPVEVETDSGDVVFSVYGLLYGGLRHRWTKRQRQVVDLSMSGMAGKDIAAYLSITPSAVSQHLHKAESNAVFAATQYWLGALSKEFNRQE